MTVVADEYYMTQQHLLQVATYHTFLQVGIERIAPTQSPLYSDTTRHDLKNGIENASYGISRQLQYNFVA
jgi:hypothetical protein